mmetsp:Transcript_70176/g.195271  ORF Transcript_70176/g.195271 Transcript_70176/m.195271 type:complete len:126 (-) Transcript_70176:1317-1694(-)
MFAWTCGSSEMAVVGELRLHEAVPFKAPNPPPLDFIPVLGRRHDPLWEPLGRSGVGEIRTEDEEAPEDSDTERARLPWTSDASAARRGGDGSALGLGRRVTQRGSTGAKTTSRGVGGNAITTGGS